MLPRIDGELSKNQYGHWLFNGKKILFRRVRTEGKKVKTEEGEKYYRGEPIGIVVALEKDRVGFSQVHHKLDNFDKDYGMRIAIRRALSNKEFNSIPLKVRHAYFDMKERAAKFDFREESPSGG